MGWQSRNRRQRLPATWSVIRARIVARDLVCRICAAPGPGRVGHRPGQRSDLRPQGPSAHRGGDLVAALIGGGRTTWALLNEPHHWLANNSGHEMAAVIERNATKSADCSSRTLAITNAPGSPQPTPASPRRGWTRATAPPPSTTAPAQASTSTPSDATPASKDSRSFRDAGRSSGGCAAAQCSRKPPRKRRNTPPSRGSGADGGGAVGRSRAIGWS